MNAGMTKAELLDVFAQKASSPPPEASQLLVRHLQCKESLKAAQCLIEAIDRYAGRDDRALSTPADLLMPLG